MKPYPKFVDVDNRTDNCSRVQIRCPRCRAMNEYYVRDGKNVRCRCPVCYTMLHCGIKNNKVSAVRMHIPWKPYEGWND